MYNKTFSPTLYNMTVGYQEFPKIVGWVADFYTFNQNNLE